jgi:enoyl-[acyl-carrier protein] reductase III
MIRDTRFRPSDWALILGASSGFGGATAVELAKRGMNIFGIHLDRQTTMPAVQQIMKEIKHAGSKCVFYNINAADAIKRNETLDEIQERFSSEPGSTIKVVLHSLAFGTLKPFVAKKHDEEITQAQMEMTLDVMAHSLVYWTQGILGRNLIRAGGRIFAMTSSGAHTVIPSYGPVSAAKASLESHVRQLAMELAPMGITINGILAGVTDTPALRKIPGYASMINVAKIKNPFHRLTTPEDVAKAIALLANDDAYFMTGNIIGVDGGEDKVGYVSLKNIAHPD